MARALLCFEILDHGDGVVDRVLDRPTQVVTILGHSIVVSSRFVRGKPTLRMKFPRVNLHLSYGQFINVKLVHNDKHYVVRLWADCTRHVLTSLNIVRGSFVARKKIP